MTPEIDARRKPGGETEDQTTYGPGGGRTVGEMGGGHMVREGMGNQTSDIWGRGETSHKMGDRETTTVGMMRKTEGNLKDFILTPYVQPDNHIDTGGAEIIPKHGK